MTGSSFISPYEYYLDLLGQWSTNIAMPSLWFCSFYLDSVNCLKSNMTNQLKRYETSLGNAGWDISDNTIRYMIDGSLQYASNSFTGCVFVKEVDLPKDMVKVERNTIYSGYMSPVVISERSPYNDLSLRFVETNASFLDLIIRPWNVLVGYNGFIARSSSSPKSVKCSYCDIVQLAKNGPYNPLAIRKIFRFNNIAPINIEGSHYIATEPTMLTTSVSFAYDSYAVLEKDTSSLINK